MINIKKPLPIPKTELTRTGRCPNQVMKVTSFQHACCLADIEKVCHPEIFNQGKDIKSILIFVNEKGNEKGATAAFTRKML